MSFPFDFKNQLDKFNGVALVALEHQGLYGSIIDCYTAQGSEAPIVSYNLRIYRTEQLRNWVKTSIQYSIDREVVPSSVYPIAVRSFGMFHVAEEALADMLEYPSLTLMANT